MYDRGHVSDIMKIKLTFQLKYQAQLISFPVSNMPSLTWSILCQEEKIGEVPRVLQRYTAEKLSSFGELALM